MTPGVEEDVPDAVNEIAKISTRRVAMQVGVAHSAVWMVLLE
jgi:hypothetical protein